MSVMWVWDTQVLKSAGQIIDPIKFEQNNSANGGRGKVGRGGGGADGKRRKQGEGDKVASKGGKKKMRVQGGTL